MAAAGTVTINGPVVVKGWQTTLTAAQGCRLVFSTGLTSAASFLMFCAGADAEIVFNNVSNAVPIYNALAGYLSGRLVFNVRNNAGGYSILPMVCGCGYAFDGASFD